MEYRYRYSPRIAKSILKITDEVPTIFENYDKLKRKGTKYSNKSDKKTAMQSEKRYMKHFKKKNLPVIHLKRTTSLRLRNWKK
ncbi:MAG: hypothetical protein L0H53_10415 [Candidatus Nitrosocosmicus sp.]|nr:hypothetical protein [Candidatus Nitrosocosmicus sp.]